MIVLICQKEGTLTWLYFGDCTNHCTTITVRRKMTQVCWEDELANQEFTRTCQDVMVQIAKLLHSALRCTGRGRHP